MALGSPQEPFCLALKARHLLVEPSLYRLAGLELDVRPAVDGYHFAGPRIAPSTGFPLPSLEGAEAAQLDPVAFGQSYGDAVEDRLHQRLDLVLVEVWVLRRDAGDELGSEHAGEEPNPSIEAE